MVLLGNQPPRGTPAEKPATTATSCANSSLPERRWLVTTALNRHQRTGREVNGDAGDPGVPPAPGFVKWSWTFGSGSSAVASPRSQNEPDLPASDSPVCRT